ncbi:transcriptional regulator, AraC family [Mucilaginibacter mallensis]|uniref:Transcriptional regulator, AraC family n=1 Tax=Mucilaginibacter mallensis TaxID=652787 RepID=A0A1H1T0L7_MUCMA|nr:AraC family transcriptional regulator [Mucilaginibacter mallensis]SDS53199.1 transcriptional regulator, AraC family [Mucilaginibacter mallensis]
MKAQLIDVGLSSSKSIHIKKVDEFFLNSPFHFHHLCELVWVEKSFGKRIVGDNIDNFDGGDLVLMAPQLPHIWQNDELFYRKKKGHRVKATVIYFPSDFPLNLTDEQNILSPIQELIKKASRGLVFYGTTSQKVSQILSALSKEEGLTKIINFLEVIDILSHSTEYRHLASISFKNLYEEKDTDRINKVYQFLMQNFYRDINLQEVADLCNMTPNAFCRFFKSRVQKSFTQFLNELRIGHACKLIQNETYSIADVCYESGYNNLTNFNKFFKSITGFTPSKYRKKSELVNPVTSKPLNY